MTKDLLTVAVVGHTNTGKTSLLRTLLRDPSFGEVSDRPATTRDVSGTVLLVGGSPLVELYDTPGLEDSIGLLEHLEGLRESQREDGVDRVERLLRSPEAGPSGSFSQEAKALRQVLRSDAALYVVDARERPLPKHRDELAVLSMCARPIVPVLNFTDRPEAQTVPWREQLSRLGLHAVAEFDTVVVDERSEERLFEKMQTLLDPFHDTLQALIEDRRRERERIIASSARVVADLLVDAAAATVTASLDDEDRVHRVTEELRDAVRRREQRCVRELLELHRFHPDDCEPEELPLENGEWGIDLFSPEAMRQFGIRAGSAAAAGAMGGLAVDVAVGGISLGAGTATGAALGAALGAGRSYGRRVLHRVRGRSELRVEQATLHLLAARQIDLVRALLARGHAARARVQIGETQKAPRAAPSGLPVPLRRARATPRWSSLTTGDGQVLRDGHGATVSNAGRETASEALAEVIRPRLEEPRTEPAVLPSH